MKIRTCAHGSFPDLKSLAHDGPRIAFVNGDSRQFAARGTHESGNLLIVVADDLNANQIGVISKWILGMPVSISSRYKRHLHRRSAAHGYPSVPMAIGDAIAILAFIERVKAGGATELLISCEYGKSRSVTVARMIQAHMPGSLSSKEGVPNAWVEELMNAAISKCRWDS